MPRTTSTLASWASPTAGFRPAFRVCALRGRHTWRFWCLLHGRDSPCGFWMMQAALKYSMSGSRVRLERNAGEFLCMCFSICSRIPERNGCFSVCGLMQNKTDPVQGYLAHKKQRPPGTLQ